MVENDHRYYYLLLFETPEKSFTINQTDTDNTLIHMHLNINWNTDTDNTNIILISMYLLEVGIFHTILIKEGTTLTDSTDAKPHLSMS